MIQRHREKRLDALAPRVESFVLTLSFALIIAVLLGVGAGLRVGLAVPR